MDSTFELTQTPMQLDPYYEYPSKKMHTGDQLLTSRFGFAPQSEQSLDQVLHEKPSPEEYNLAEKNTNDATFDAFDAFLNSPPMHGRKMASFDSGKTNRTRRISRRMSMMSLDSRRQSLSSLMHSASASGDIAQVGRLLGAGALPGKKSKDGLSPAHLAAAGGHLGVLKSLVIHGAKLDVVDSDGRTPLHAAVLAEHPDLVPFLVGNGAPVDCKDNYGSKQLSTVETYSDCK